MLQHPARTLAQSETCGPLNSFSFEHGTVLPKPSEMAGKLLQIIAEVVRTILGSHHFEHEAKVQKVLAQGDFFRRLQR